MNRSLKLALPLFQSTGGLIKLTAENGADILGNMVESSSLSPNRQLYGEILNQASIGPG